MDNIKQILIAMVVGAVIFAGGAYFQSNNQKVDGIAVGTSSNCESGAATCFSVVDTEDGFTVDGTTVIDGSGNWDGVLTPSAVTDPNQTIATTSDTLVAADFGETIFVTAASGTTITLPAASAGAFFRFVIATAFDTANVIIDSAEGDNIEGALIVAGAVVDCDAEDQINFVNDGENLGDFVELISDGTSWYIGASGALTAAKLTCTDPS